MIWKTLAITVLLLTVCLALLATGAESDSVANPELALLVGPGGLKNVIVKKGDAWHALTEFTHPHHIYDFAVSPDGSMAFVWHMDDPPRAVSVYDLGDLKMLARFRPGYGGELQWTAANTLLHIWGAGTSVRIARVYDRLGKTLFQAGAESFSVSPSGLYLAALPVVPASRQKLKIRELRRYRKVLESGDEQDIRSVVESAWNGDGELRVRFEDSERRVRALTLILGEAPVLEIQDQSLLLRTGGESRCLLRAVQADRADSAASVRRAHSLVTIPDGSRAAVFVSLNRQMHVLPIRIGEEGQLEYGKAMPVPGATEASFSPRGDALLLTCTRDSYLPPKTTYRLNRGAMVVRFSEFTWHSTIESALHEPGRGLWYGRPEDRFVPAGDFEILTVTWQSDECSLKIRDGEGVTRTVTLR